MQIFSRIKFAKFLLNVFDAIEISGVFKEIIFFLSKRLFHLFKNVKSFQLFKACMLHTVAGTYFNETKLM